MQTSEFIQSLVDSSPDKNQLRANVLQAISDMATFTRALDEQLAQAPAVFAALDPDYATFLAALPFPCGYCVTPVEVPLEAPVDPVAELPPEVPSEVPPETQVP